MLDINEIRNIVSEFNEGYLSNLEELKDDFDNYYQNDIESLISEKIWEHLCFEFEDIDYSLEYALKFYTFNDISTRSQDFGNGDDLRYGIIELIKNDIFIFFKINPITFQLVEKTNKELVKKNSYKWK